MSWVSHDNIQSLLNVTADSLAEYCGLTGDRQENSMALERQVCSTSPPYLMTFIYTLACFTSKEPIPHYNQFVRSSLDTVTVTVLLNTCQ